MGGVAPDSVQLAFLYLGSAAGLSPSPTMMLESPEGQAYAAAVASDRYYRAQSEVHVSGSFGLGLYITRLIAEAHLGRAEVQSTRGQGSTFSLVLPLRDADAVE